MLKVGDRVRVKDPLAAFSSIHWDELFLKALRKVETEAFTQGDFGLSSKVARALIFFTGEPAKSNRIIPEPQEEGIVRTFVLMGPSSAEVVTVVESLSKNAEAPFFNILPEGVEVISQPTPYEGYTKTSEGFWTNRKNWSKGLGLL